jgi:4-diphosphocytidyl-2-C-methyl-D-erythritol kinase
MIIFPPAKINLGLHIVRRRADGYHDLETVFYPIALQDALEIHPSRSTQAIRLYSSGLPVDGNEAENLVVKAYRLLAAAYSLPPVDAYLYKRIPMGAGLGGGSSDAAFMLKGLNQQFGLSISDEALEQMASKLGADCPFFIRNRPAFAEGIGDRFTPLSLSLSGYVLVLVKPEIHVSTKEAFARITPKSSEYSLKELITQPLSCWKEKMKNDFEESVFPQYPQIGAIKAQLYDAGAIYASMSGSGSSLFGIFPAGCKLPVFPNQQRFVIKL